MGQSSLFFKAQDLFQPISHVYSIICEHPDSEEAQRLFSAINFTTKLRTPLYKRHDFIRKVCYHVPKVHELNLLLSIRAGYSDTGVAVCMCVSGSPGIIPVHCGLQGYSDTGVAVCVCA